MAKKRNVICPECGHKHAIKGRSQVAGIHSKKLTKNQFEYTAIMPEFLSFNDADEIEKFLTVPEQALLVGLIGLGGGSLVGFLASQPFPVEYCFQIIPSCALAGFTIAEAVLTAERFCILGRTLPWFARQKAKLSIGDAPGDVELTIDHRYRDGNTESGRTINRFGTLPVDVERFNEWAQGALVGKSLAVNKWVPSTILFSQPEYVRLLGHLTAGGVVVNRGSNKGYTLTGGGRRALSRHLADWGIAPPSPASETDFLGERLAQAKVNSAGMPPLPRSGVCVGGSNGQ